ncbi:MAG: hypothetical protein Q9211_002530 [Gyalolechia sp. 1 TL-2023]
MALPPNVTFSGVSEELEDCNVDFFPHLQPEKGKSPFALSRSLLTPPLNQCNASTSPDAPLGHAEPSLRAKNFPWQSFKRVLRESKTPIIFSWSPSAAETPPSNFNNRISWIEGPEQEWVAADYHTGCVRTDVDPFAPTIVIPQPNSEKEVPSSAVSASTSAFKTPHLKSKRESKSEHEPEQQSQPECPPGYPITTSPFHLFLELDLVPIDRDPDVVWMHEGDVFRAYRISTSQPDDSVVPDLVVGGDPPLTIWEYIAATRRHQFAMWASGVAAAEAVVFRDEDAHPGVSPRRGGAKVSREDDTAPQGGGGGLRADTRLVRASVPQGRRFSEGQAPRFPLMPVQESALIRYLQNGGNAVLDLPVPNDGPPVHPTATATAPQDSTSIQQRPSTPPAGPIHASSNINNKHPHPPEDKDAARQAKRPESSSLPSLPSRRDRIRIIRTFNRHAASTFSALKRQRRQRAFEEEKMRKYLVASRRWGMKV